MNLREVNSYWLEYLAQSNYVYSVFMDDKDLLAHEARGTTNHEHPGYRPTTGVEPAVTVQKLR